MRRDAYIGVIFVLLSSEPYQFLIYKGLFGQAVNCSAHLSSNSEVFERHTDVRFHVAPHAQLHHPNWHHAGLRATKDVRNCAI